MNRVTLLVAILVLTAGQIAPAQDSPARTERSCFRGRPLPACRSYWITESGYGIRLSSVDRYTSSAPGGRFLPSVAVGGMRNLGRRVAVGGTVETGLLGGLYLAAKPRVRYWLSTSAALDVSPGFLLARSENMPRFAPEVSLMFQDRIGIAAQSFLIPASEYQAGGSPITRQRLTTYLGLRFGSKLGVAGAVADAATLLGLVAVYLVACGRGCD